jgi:hypothetical protein
MNQLARLYSYSLLIARQNGENGHSYRLTSLSLRALIDLTYECT